MNLLNQFPMASKSFLWAYWTESLIRDGAVNKKFKKMFF